MGRPEDVRITQNLKRQSKNSEIQELKEIITSQAEMIKSLTQLLEKVGANSTVIVSSPSRDEDTEVHEKEGRQRPKLDSFFINPSPSVNITQSNLDETRETTTISEDISSDAEKLKMLMNKRKS